MILFITGLMDRQVNLWNFFATIQGKGENDGVGGNVKNGVWQRVLQQKEVVDDLESFGAVAQERFLSIKTVSFTSDEIREATSHLKERYQKFSTPLPNTQKFYHIRIEENKVVRAINLAHVTTKKQQMMTIMMMNARNL